MKQQYKHLFPYKWNLSDGYPSEGIKPNGCKVFGTFICGGGSSMGYKLAGFEHLGGVEIDPKVADIYKTNHKPKHLFVQDLREFNKRDDLPKELYNLDLLDGSPPCSSFSMAGNRDKDWGKKKQFREGQAFQRLDDLVYTYIETIEKLKPKVALLENVKGLIQGNAKSYAKEMKKRFEDAGYRVQVFLLNAASMGVPQKRERVFFIGLRNDFDLPKLVLSFNEKPIVFGEIDNGLEQREKISGVLLKYLKYVTDSGILQTFKKSLGGRLGAVGFSYRVSNNLTPYTVIANGHNICYTDNTHYITKKELIKIGSYPLDYNFKTLQPKYLIGMSVPPVMTAQISNQIYKQWLSKV